MLKFNAMVVVKVKVMAQAKVEIKVNVTVQKRIRVRNQGQDRDSMQVRVQFWVGLRIRVRIQDRSRHGVSETRSRIRTRTLTVVHGAFSATAEHPVVQLGLLLMYKHTDTGPYHDIYRANMARFGKKPASFDNRAYSKEFFGVHNFKSSCMM